MKLGNMKFKRFNEFWIRLLLSYLKELLFVDEDAEAAAADKIDEWFKAERAELLAPGGVKGRWGGSGWLADEWWW